MKILTINIEEGASNYDIIEINTLIINTQADITIINECNGIENIKYLIQIINYYYCYFSYNDSAIISKYPIENPISEHSFFAKILGAFIIPIHLNDFPYQPYQAHSIKYCYDTCQRSVYGEQNLIDEANMARGAEIDKIIMYANELKKYGHVIIAGDFNEPSHLDWTVSNTLHKYAIRFPTSIKLEKNGYIDSYRTVYKDEFKYPGYTWFGLKSERIDFIYSTLYPLKSDVLPTSSDHYAVFSTF
jgi:hypothetical protein